MNEEIPDRVVRFFGSTDYALQTIALKEITLIRSTKINDPFDLRIPFATDFDDSYHAFVGSVQKIDPDLMPAFSEADFRNTLEKIRLMADEKRKYFFILSACGVHEDNEPKENLYMWAHYANGHRGVAIELDAKKIEQHLKEKYQLENAIFRVRYSNEIPKISAQDIYQAISGKIENLDKNVLLCATTKSKVWEGENEWRFSTFSSDTKLDIISYRLPDNAITSVYLGSQIQLDEKKKFLFEVRKNFPNAKIFQASLAREQFALEFDEIK